MEKKTNNPAITKSYAKKMETISPFELKNKLIIWQMKVSRR